jgi:hypothetical protein
VRGVPGGDGLVDSPIGPCAVDYGVSWLRHWVATPSHTQMLRVSSSRTPRTTKSGTTRLTGWGGCPCPASAHSWGDTARDNLDRVRIIADHGDSCQAQVPTSIAGHGASSASSEGAACL